MQGGNAMLLIRNVLFVLALWLIALPVFAQDATTPEPPAAAPEAVPAAPTEPDQVTVGVYINDIQQLDLQTHSYAMDFYVWLRWKNPGPYAISHA